MAPKRHAASSTPAQAASSATSRSVSPTPPTPMQTKTSASSSSATSGLSASSSTQDIILHIWKRYLTQTPQRTLLLDAFMGFLVLVGGVQFLYCILAGNYPFNAFLSGFSAAVGQFVLTASLRMQTSEQSSAKSGSKGKSGSTKEAEGVSSERAFADYIFGSLILHFFCINFIN
ncbi:oligosaccharyltransferase complex subunit epsilon [Arachnomyces sp. PD_36]|nr:oligosaccharyltransferase complex subunit epsilon [Arachnomyces sp. PD_36]